MTDLDGWELKPSGLMLKVSPYDKNDLLHREIAETAVRNTTETVARVHGAPFNENSLRTNLRLLNASDGGIDSELLLDLYFAKWDVCEHKAVLIGASLGWNSFAYTPEGRLALARYTEDVSIPQRQLRKLMTSKPEGLDLPKESLITSLEEMHLRKMYEQQGVDYRFGEVAPKNTTMMRHLNTNGANMGQGLENAVLEYERMPGTSLDYWPMDVKIRPIIWKGKKSQKHFIVRWKEGEYDMRFVVTKGIATASGNPRIDIRPWDNGKLPHPHIQECVAASVIRAIEEEATRRNWGLQENRHLPSPIIPITNERSEIYRALFRSGGDQVLFPARYKSSTFDAPVPNIHIHIIGQRHMIESFKGAQTRIFGQKPMIPGVNILAKHYKPAL